MPGVNPIVVVCVPSMEMWHADFGNALIALCARLQVVCKGRFSIVNQRGSIIPLQRQSIAEIALEKEPEYLLWLDSDMTFPPTLFEDLKARNLPVVACNYVKRVIPAMPNAKALNGKIIPTNPEDTGLEEADSAGFGVVLMKAEALKDLEKPWFDVVWVKKGDEYEMVGEDVFFFRKLRAFKGISLYIDHDVSHHIGHVGTFEYTNDLCGITLADAVSPEIQEKVMAR